MNRTRALLLAVVVVTFAGCARNNVVWDTAQRVGAQIVACPAADCGPLFASARAALERPRPNHAAIASQRTARLVCAPEGAPCVVTPPLGAGPQILVVFDFEQGPPAIVTCWLAEAAELGDWRGVSCEV